MDGPSASGKPTKLTPERMERIVKHIKNGNFLSNAFALEGVASSTGRMWLSKGAKEHKGRHAEFRRRVREAQAEMESDLLTGIRASAMGGNVRAATWMLERVDPYKYNIDVSEAIETVFRAITEVLEDRPEDLEKILQSVRAKLEDKA